VRAGPTARRAAGKLVEPGAPGTRVGSAAARQHAGDHSLRRGIATSRAVTTSRANANSIVGRDFRPNHTERRALAGHGRPMDCAMMKECP
jgi:hypothetical protein